MHYGACDFAIDCAIGPTITVLPPNEMWQGLIGQRNHLSTFDALTMSFVNAGSRCAIVVATFPGELS
jgi:hypothetical protein